VSLVGDEGVFAAGSRAVRDDPPSKRKRSILWVVRVTGYFPKYLDEEGAGGAACGPPVSFLNKRVTAWTEGTIAMLPWPAGEIRLLPLEEFGEVYRRYRLAVPEAEAAMARSLRRYGQMSPLVVCVREEHPQLIDGFKRLTAARGLPGLRRLSARAVEVDERAAKAAIYGLNCVGRRTQELEEAWIVQALVRDDGLSQMEAADLLGRHKSWVCRRLALLEKLGHEAREDLRMGLLSPTAARQLTRLPAGNQPEVLAVARQEALSADELRGVVDLLLASASRQKEQYVLAKPREALRQAQMVTPPAWDPRLSSAGNRIAKQLGYLVEQLGRMEQWLQHRGRGELTACDRAPLTPGFTRLSREARSVAELAEDFLAELTGS
jgi:ParB-like chromosome segregation protein Spo0J